MELRAAWPFIITPQCGMCRCHNVGLYTAWTFIAKPRHRDGTQHGHLSSRHNVGCDHTTTWNCVPHGHLSSRHNAGCADATTSDCTPHGHSSPNHGIGMVRNMAIYHHTTTWGVTTSPRRITCNMVIHYRATTWSITIPSRGVAPPQFFIITS